MIFELIRACFRSFFLRGKLKTPKALCREQKIIWSMLCICLLRLSKHLENGVEMNGINKYLDLIESNLWQFHFNFKRFELAPREKADKTYCDQVLAFIEFGKLIMRITRKFDKLKEDLHSNGNSEAAIRMVKLDLFKPLLNDKSVWKYIPASHMQKTLKHLSKLGNTGRSQTSPAQVQGK